MTNLPRKNFVGHNNNFNFLRLLLATLVILGHSPELIDGNRDRDILTSIFHTLSFGELAVDGFFLLSGYLIVQSWERSPDLINFLKKRILRIYPGFIVATLVCGLIVGPLGASPPEYFAQFNIFAFLKGMLFLQGPSVPPVFAGQPYPSVNGAMWTIAYEFRCYLMVALLGLCGIVKRPRQWLIFSVVILILSLFPSVVSKISFPGSGFLFGYPSHLIRLLPFFSAGGCFYLFRNKIPYKLTWVLVALPIVILAMFNLETVSIFLPTLGGYIFLFFAFLPIHKLQRFSIYPDVSYGVYLYGWPTQKLLLWYFPSLSPWLLFFFAFPISFVCGFFSWNLVEKPFMRLKQKQLKNTT